MDGDLRIWLGKGKQCSACRGISVTRRFVSLQFARIKKLQTVAFVRPPSIRHQSFRGLYACRSVLRSTGSRVFVCDANLAPSLCHGWRPEGFCWGLDFRVKPPPTEILPNSFAGLQREEGKHTRRCRMVIQKRKFEDQDLRVKGSPSGTKVTADRSLTEPLGP